MTCKSHEIIGFKKRLNMCPVEFGKITRGRYRLIKEISAIKVLWCNFITFF